MRTPLTITAKLWSYCQNVDGCPYCIADCNKRHWRYRGNFKTLPRHEVLDVDQLILWRNKFTPESVIHLSGGEPLLRPDIEIQVEKLIKAGISVTITTNGLLIHRRPRLLKLPLKWIVTHHECNDYAKWKRNADLIADKPHIASRVIWGQVTEQNRHDFDHLYVGLNFMWAPLWRPRLTDWSANKNDFDCVATKVIHLIEPDGRVYPCSSAKKPSIGNIYSMTYHPETADHLNTQCRECVSKFLCGAYQTAVLTNCLNVPFR